MEKNFMNKHFLLAFGSSGWFNENSVLVYFWVFHLRPFRMFCVFMMKMNYVFYGTFVFGN